MGKRKRIFLGVVSLILVVGIAVGGYMVARAATQSVSDSFTDETKLGTGTDKVDQNTGAGQITLASCYSPNPAWSKIASTTVRDISSLTSSTTIAKDIYCDNNNCILWTSGAAAPGATVCIATNNNVYGNILWARTDDSTNKVWATSNFSIYTVTGDVGGTHTTNLTVGNNASNVGDKYWLERFYTSTTGTFPAMDTCKAKGLGWRLPTILELDSIRDQAKGSSPYTRLPNITANGYWSSSENNSTFAYYLYFSDGSVFYVNKSSGFYVRCVRAY